MRRKFLVSFFLICLVAASNAPCKEMPRAREITVLPEQAASARNSENSQAHAGVFRIKTAQADSSAGTAAGEVQEEGKRREVEVFKSESREEAERSAERIKERGYETVIWSEITKGGKIVYRVFVVVRGGQQVDASSLTSGQSGAEEERVSSEEEERPVGMSKALGEAVQKRARFIHASLSVAQEFFDNAFSTPDNKESGYATILTPEVWALLPHYYENPLPMEDSFTHSPGGLLVTRLRPEVKRQYYAYLSYKADIPVFTKNLTQGDGVSSYAKARGIYNFGRGLSLDLIDQFVISYETLATDLSVLPGAAAKYKSNLFNAIVFYDTSNRTRLRLDYANYYLSLDDPTDAFRNRTDNALSGYIFYRLKPKTSAFVQYTYTDIKYKTSHSYDSREHLFAGGVRWDITARSAGIIKGGYGIKDFVSSDDKVDNLILEAQIKHKFSAKRHVTLAAFRKTNETDIDASSYVLSHGVRIDCMQLFSPKFLGFLNLVYTHDRYHSRQGVADPFEGLKNDIYEARLTLQYKFKKWLESDIGYAYTRRDSNVEAFSFTNNALMFRVKGIL